MDALEELYGIRDEIQLYRISPQGQKPFQMLAMKADFLYTDLACVDDLHTDTITFHPDFNGTQNP